MRIVNTGIVGMVIVGLGTAWYEKCLVWEMSDGIFGMRNIVKVNIGMGIFRMGIVHMAIVEYGNC